jgi:sugar phosphate isomerase/epimerase
MGADTSGFFWCMNTSTIKGQGLGLEKEIEVIAKAGYAGIEPWVREIDAHVQNGGSLSELKKRFEDAGLEVVNLIGFFEWMVDDEALREKGLKEARRNMELAAAVGCKRLAAPPVGATAIVGMEPAKMIERYARLLEIGDEYGVVPVLEFWGMSKSLNRLGEAVHVAMETGHRKATVLADVFHMYKAGCPHNGLRMVGPETVAILHMNDYPANPPRETIKDADRVYPGDGVAPIVQILRDLKAAGFRGALSLELFNQTYYAKDALEVAKTGLEKMKALAARI